MGRPKQEYQERPSDEDGTPFERFQRLAKRVIATPKARVDEQGSEQGPDEHSPA